jgi:hypothetical protein
LFLDRLGERWGGATLFTEFMGQLGNGNHKYQVIKQFQPGNPAVF